MRPLLHFYHLHKSLQRADILAIIRINGDIFAVLKGAREVGWGAGAPKEGRQWDLIPIFKYSRKKRSSSRDY